MNKEPELIRDPVAGHLEIGVNLRNEVVLNLPRDMTGHINFTPAQAQALARLLLKQAEIAIERMKNND